MFPRHSAVSLARSILPRVFTLSPYLEPQKKALERVGTPQRESFLGSASVGMAGPEGARQVYKRVPEVLRFATQR